MATETTATKDNQFYDAINLCLSEGKNYIKKQLKACLTKKKYDGDPKDAIKFVERVQSKSE